MAVQENPPNTVQLEESLNKYINDDGDEEENLMRLLQLVSIDDRHNLLMNAVVAEGPSRKSCLHQAVSNQEEKLVKCMLDGFTNDQVWRVVKLEWEKGYTALHCAAGGRSMELVRYLLDHMTEQQALELLKRQHGKETPLQKAARGNGAEMVELILSYLSADQQRRLLRKMDPDGGKSMEVKQFISAAKREELADRCDELGKQLATVQKEMIRLTHDKNGLTVDIASLRNQLAEQNTALQRMGEEFETIRTRHVEVQEIPDVD